MPFAGGIAIQIGEHPCPSNDSRTSKYPSQLGKPRSYKDRSWPGPSVRGGIILWPLGKVPTLAWFLGGGIRAGVCPRPGGSESAITLRRLGVVGRRVPGDLFISWALGLAWPLIRGPAILGPVVPDSEGPSPLPPCAGWGRWSAVIERAG